MLRERVLILKEDSEGEALDFKMELVEKLDYYE
jgi:hypothetical protein